MLRQGDCIGYCHASRLLSVALVKVCVETEHFSAIRTCFYINVLLEKNRKSVTSLLVSKVYIYGSKSVSNSETLLPCCHFIYLLALSKTVVGYSEIRN